MNNELIPVRTDDIITQDVDGETLILNNHGAEIHQLNDVASLVWKYCDGKHSITDIVQILLNHYAVSHEQLTHDIETVICQFKEKGLLK